MLHGWFTGCLGTHATPSSARQEKIETPIHLLFNRHLWSPKLCLLTMGHDEPRPITHACQFNLEMMVT